MRVKVLRGVGKEGGDLRKRGVVGGTSGHGEVMKGR